MSLPKPYYEHDGITIYHGDCREVLPELQDIELVLTDPPYGCGIKYGPSYDDNRDAYWKWFLPTVELMRRTGRILAFTHRNEALRHIVGWDWIAVWNKPGAFGSRIGNSAILPHWEPIFLFGIHSMGTASEYSADVFTFNPVPSNNRTSKAIGREKWERDSFEYHPCPKPPQLYQRLIQVFGQGGGIICDPFTGSGTTLRAAKDLRRKAIGIEIEEKYCEIAAKRLSQEVFDF